MTNSAVENIKRLYAELDEYDQGKGRFQLSRNRSLPVGVEPMSRYISACSKTRPSSVPHRAYSKWQMYNLKCRCSSN